MALRLRLDLQAVSDLKEICAYLLAEAGPLQTASAATCANAWRACGTIPGLASRPRNRIFASAGRHQFLIASTTRLCQRLS